MEGVRNAMIAAFQHLGFAEFRPRLAWFVEKTLVARAKQLSLKAMGPCHAPMECLSSEGCSVDMHGAVPAILSSPLCIRRLDLWPPQPPPPGITEERNVSWESDVCVTLAVPAVKPLLACDCWKHPWTASADVFTGSRGRRVAVAGIEDDDCCYEAGQFFGFNVWWYQRRRAGLTESGLRGYKLRDAELLPNRGFGGDDIFRLKTPYKRLR